VIREEASNTKWGRRGKDGKGLWRISGTTTRRVSLGEMKKRGFWAGGKDELGKRSREG